MYTLFVNDLLELPNKLKVGIDKFLCHFTHIDNFLRLAHFFQFLT